MASNKNNFKIIADDLGLAIPVNDGILSLYKDGKINGVSILPTGDVFEDAIMKLTGMGTVNTGVHLTLIEEPGVLPVEEIPSLIDGTGRLHKNHSIFFWRYIFNLINFREVEAELRAQIQKCIDNGLTPQFLNSHQHLHLLPKVMDIVIKLAIEFGIPEVRLVSEPVFGRPGSFIRKLQAMFLGLLSGLAVPKLKSAGLAYNDKFVGFLHAGNITTEDVAVARKKGAELNCHPGYEDDALRVKYRGWGHYNWQKELEILKSETGI